MIVSKNSSLSFNFSERISINRLFVGHDLQGSGREGLVLQEVLIILTAITEQKPDYVILALMHLFYETKVNNSNEVAGWAWNVRREFLYVDDMAVTLGVHAVPD